MEKKFLTGKETIAAWLDYKKTPLRKRDVYKDHIEILAGAIDEGYLILNEDKSLTQKLRFPLKGGMAKRDLEKLTYVPFIRAAEIHKHLIGTKPSDADGRAMRYIAALTSKPKEVIALLDSSDLETGISIAVFFA